MRGSYGTALRECATVAQGFVLLYETDTIDY